MLTVWEAMQKRRSIRKFGSGDVSDEVIEQMLQAARLAPSGGNRQPWRFLVIRDEETRKELCRIKGQATVGEAPVIIVCLGDLDRYTAEAEKQRRQTEPLEVGAGRAISEFSANPEDAIRSQHFSTLSQGQALTHMTGNSYNAVNYMLLMATALGVGACWIGTSSFVDELSRFLGYPPNLVPVAMVLVGYPAEDYSIPERKRLSLDELMLKPFS